MPALNQNATIYRGGSESLTVTVLDESGAPIDLTGFTLHYRVAATPGGATLLVVSSPTITTATNVATIPLTIAQTKSLPLGELRHELFRVDGAVATSFMQGTLMVAASQMALNP